MAGRLAVGQNRRTHGLNTSALLDPKWAERAYAVAKALSGRAAPAEGFLDYARWYVETERIRVVRASLLRRYEAWLGGDGLAEPDDGAGLLNELRTLDGYDRKVCSRLRKASLALAEAGLQAARV